MEKKNEVEVVIGGEVYRLMAVESEEYIQKLASYINKKIADIYKSKSSPTVSGYLRTLYISINIADEFFKQQEKFEEILLENTKLTESLKKLEEKNSIYVKEIEKLKLYVDPTLSKEQAQLLEKIKLENKQKTELLEKARLENRQQIELLDKSKLENKQQTELLEKIIIETKEQAELLEKIKLENKAYFEEMTVNQSENHLLKQRIKELKNQLDLSEKELQEYIDTFSEN